MSLIADILPPANVVADLAADGKRSLLEQVGALFENSTRLPRAKVVDSLLAREKLGSTAMGHGIAIPHVRNPVILHITRPAVTICFLKQPIDFQAIDGQPVHKRLEANGTSEARASIAAHITELANGKALG